LHFLSYLLLYIYFIIQKTVYISFGPVCVVIISSDLAIRFSLSILLCGGCRLFSWCSRCCSRSSSNSFNRNLPNRSSDNLTPQILVNTNKTDSFQAERPVVTKQPTFRTFGLDSRTSTGTYRPSISTYRPSVGTVDTITKVTYTEHITSCWGSSDTFVTEYTNNNTSGNANNTDVATKTTATTNKCTKNSSSRS
jgi:hypothetical protein